MGWSMIEIGFLYRNSYSGMQVNETRHSVEDKLVDCLFMLDKIEPWNVIKSSKFDWERCSSEMRNLWFYRGTDKGVSARSIVVSGKLMDYDDEFDSSMQNQLAVEQLNHLLPEDIRVFSCTCFQWFLSKDTRVSKSFNPHLNTHTRTYSYYLPIDQYQSSHFCPKPKHRTGRSHRHSKVPESTLCIFRHAFHEELFRLHSVRSLLVFCNHPVAIEIRISVSSTCEPCSSYDRSYHFSNHISATPLTIGNEHYLHVLLNGNSFLYHQIRKMIGGAVAASCGSWSFPYLNACMNLITFSLSSSVYDAGHSSASGSQHTVGTAFRFVPSGQKHFSKQDRASEGGGVREKEEESQSKQKVRHLTANEQFSRRKCRTFIYKRIEI